MSALVLGLLVASAKESFDDMENENIDSAAKIIALHHILVRYGSQADGVRDELRRAVTSILKSDWQEDDLSGDDDGPEPTQNGLEVVKDRLNDLMPKTDAQRSRLAEAEQICGDLAQARWLFVERNRTSLPPALLIALVFWLSLLFMGIALFAPHNKTVLVTLILCSLSVSVSTFIIYDLRHPLKGLITISSHPMRDALDHLGPK
jgi:hypothetical protein